MAGIRSTVQAGFIAVIFPDGFIDVKRALGVVFHIGVPRQVRYRQPEHCDATSLHAATSCN